MDILEGRKLDEAMAKALGWYIDDGYVAKSDMPGSIMYPLGKAFCASDDLTWAVVDGLRAKGWVVEECCEIEDKWYALLVREGMDASASALHPHRNPAILNACLRAMEVDNGE